MQDILCKMNNSTCIIVIIITNITITINIIVTITVKIIEKVIIDKITIIFTKIKIIILAY